MTNFLWICFRKASVSIFLLGAISCQNIEDKTFGFTTSDAELGNFNDKQEPLIITIGMTHDVITLPSELDMAPFPDVAVGDPMLGGPDFIPPIPIRPVTAPWAFAQSPFSKDPTIPPWQANYVGSYGVLPTRYAAKGPFLYSFTRAVDDDDNRKRRKFR